MCFEKAKSLRSIKSRLSLPKNWLSKTEDTVVINYCIDGHMKFLTIDRDEVPRILKEFGLITNYEGLGKNRRMYCSHVPDCKGSKGFTSDWQETQVQCEEIKIYESDVIHLIACKEHEKIVRLMEYYKLN